MERVMIVEDEATTALVLEEPLKNLGYEVAGVAHSGEKALDMAKELTPDLLLMDIAGERITVPAKAIFNVKHERERDSEEIEFQFKRDRD